MDNRKGIARSHSFGDAAADGLIAGLAAGAAMALFLALVSLIWEDSPGTLLALFSPEGAQTPALGLLAHLAVSSVYGILFGLLIRLFFRRLGIPVWILGLIYGSVLALGAELFLLPVINSPLQDIPVTYFVAAHLVYGLILGLVAGRSLGMLAEK